MHNFYIFFIFFTLVQAHRYRISKSTSSYQSPLTFKKGESFLLKPFPSIRRDSSYSNNLESPYLPFSTFSQHQEGLLPLKLPPPESLFSFFDLFPAPLGSLTTQMTFRISIFLFQPFPSTRRVSFCSNDLQSPYLPFLLK
jgi:hypothetical protein